MSDENMRGSTQYTAGVTVSEGIFRRPMKPQVTAGVVSVARNDLGSTLERVLNGYYDLSNDRDRDYVRNLLERAKEDSVIEIGRPKGWTVDIDVTALEDVKPGGQWIVLNRKAE